MKAIMMLKLLHLEHICTGQAYINSAKSYKLSIIKGNLNPKTLYYHSFRQETGFDDPDVILTLGTDNKQYLYKIEL